MAVTHGSRAVAVKPEPKLIRADMATHLENNLEKAIDKLTFSTDPSSWPAYDLKLKSRMGAELRKVL